VQLWASCYCTALALLLHFVLPATAHCDTSKLASVPCEPHCSDLLLIVTVLSLLLPFVTCMNSTFIDKDVSELCEVKQLEVQRIRMCSSYLLLHRNINTFSIKHNMSELHLYHCVFLKELCSYRLLDTFSHNWQAISQEFL
jgi:hypothetical protein